MCLADSKQQQQKQQKMYWLTARKTPSYLHRLQERKGFLHQGI